MLRSSEIKPLFVDLSLCDKSFSFFSLLYVVGAYASEPLTFFYTSPHVECVCEGWCGCVCVPYLGECVYESMLSLMRPHMRDSWVRIHLTCGCVYIWLVGAYATLVGAYTVGCVYSGVRIQGVRIQWGAYTVGCVYSGVRIQGCVCRGVYAGVGLGVNNAYKSVWCVSTK